MHLVLRLRIRWAGHVVVRLSHRICTKTLVDGRGVHRLRVDEGVALNNTQGHLRNSIFPVDEFTPKATRLAQLLGRSKGSI